MKATLAFSLRIVSFITIPAAVGLIVLREPIIRVLFEHGQFVAESTELTTRALFYYAFGLPAFAAIRLIVPAFYSSHDTRTPVLVAAFALALNIALNMLCLHWFFSDVPQRGTGIRHGGRGRISISSRCLPFFACATGGWERSQILVSVARIGLCAGLMGGVCWMALRVSHFNAYQRFLPRLGVFMGLILGATAVYLALAWILRCHEMSEVYGIALHGDREPEAIGATDCRVRRRLGNARDAGCADQRVFELHQGGERASLPTPAPPMRATCAGSRGSPQQRKLPLAAVSRDDLIEYLGSLYREHLDSRTVARHLVSLRNLFRFALVGRSL